MVRKKETRVPFCKHVALSVSLSLSWVTALQRQLSALSAIIFFSSTSTTTSSRNCYWFAFPFLVFAVKRACCCCWQVFGGAQRPCQGCQQIPTPRHTAPVHRRQLPPATQTPVPLKSSRQKARNKRLTSLLLLLLDVFSEKRKGRLLPPTPEPATPPRRSRSFCSPFFLLACPLFSLLGHTALFNIATPQAARCQIARSRKHAKHKALRIKSTQ